MIQREGSALTLGKIVNLCKNAMILTRGTFVGNGYSRFLESLSSNASDNQVFTSITLHDLSS